MSHNHTQRQVVGTLTGGSIRQNLTASLQSNHGLEIGSYLVIPTDDQIFYALVHDLAYRPADPRYASRPIQKRIPGALAARVNSQAVQVIAELMPGQAIARTGKNAGQVLPFSTLPALHSDVCLPQDSDIAGLFGDPNTPGFFVVGYTREQGHPIAIDMTRLTRRGVAISGATGTGKSQLIRILLSGIIRQDLASALVLDLHNDLAYDDVADTGKRLVGLKSLFSDRVFTVGLGRNATVRGIKPDHCLELSLSDISPSDVMILTDALNLTNATGTVVSALVHSFGKRWLVEFLNMARSADNDSETVREERNTGSPRSRSVASWAKQAGVSRQSAEALWSKLSRLGRLGFVSSSPNTTTSIGVILNALRSGKTVILSFGQHKDELDYLLTSNLLARHISELWTQAADSYRTTQAQAPRPLIIVVEEAHRFLDKANSGQTVFGTLAREMRKSSVVLWASDQRMSTLDDEITSQFGTRISGWLGDEDDIKAVTAGLPGRDILRRMIANLRSSGQCVILGYATPSPIAIETRRVDDQFVRDMTLAATPDTKAHETE
ncbi:MAG: ATP-binding protein [Chloroflexi bacterium]|nr:ATP-binding protein [Chloroflexota bacterium]